MKKFSVGWVFKKATGWTPLLMWCMCLFVVLPLHAESNDNAAEEVKAAESIEAEEEAEGVKKARHVYPLIKYDYASMGTQGLHSPGSGVLYMSDQTMLMGFYTRHSFTDSLSCDCPDVYHSIDMLYDGGRGSHRFLYLFKSEADKPVAGGFDSFQTAAVYGYRIVNTSRNSLVLGGGLAVSDFGIELEDGRPWPMIPVPLIRFTHESKLMSASFDFITGPNLSVTFLPENRFRLKGDFRMDQFRDIQDLIFEVAFMYRFFGKDHPMGDFAGLAVGVKNDGYSFAVDGRDDPAEVNYYSVFGTLDFTLLKISGGYVVQGRERYSDDSTTGLGDGFSLSIEGMYQF